jgi:Zn-dependent protease with chaperone function
VNLLTLRRLGTAGVVLMAVVGCAAAVWPSVDDAITTLVITAAVSLLLAGLGVAARWAHNEWSWRRELSASEAAASTVDQATVGEVRGQDRSARPDMAEATS